MKPISALHPVSEDTRSLKRIISPQQTSRSTQKTVEFAKEHYLEAKTKFESAKTELSTLDQWVWMHRADSGIMGLVAKFFAWISRTLQARLDNLDQLQLHMTHCRRFVAINEQESQIPQIAHLCCFDDFPVNKAKAWQEAAYGVSIDGLDICKLDETFQNDPEIALLAVESNGLALEHVSSFFQSNKKIVLAAVVQNAGAFAYASHELQMDVDIIHAAQCALASIKSSSMDSSATFSPPASALALVDQKLLHVRDGTTQVGAVGRGLIAYADLWFNLHGLFELPTIAPSVRWQLLHAASAHTTQDGWVNMGDEFGFEHLKPTELALLYRIIHAYQSSCGVSTLFDTHLATLKAHFMYVVLQEPECATLLIKALIDQADSSLQPLINLLTQRLGTATSVDGEIDKALIAVDSPSMFAAATHASAPTALLPVESVEALKCVAPITIVKTGTTSSVHLFPHLAMKVYFGGENAHEQANLDKFFHAEVEGLQLVEGMNGGLHLMGVSHAQKLIVMTRLTTKSALTLVCEADTDSKKWNLLTIYGRELAYWATKFHEKTLYQLPINETDSYESLALTNPCFHAVVDFQGEISRIKGNDVYRAKIQEKFNQFIKEPLGNVSIYGAFCHNDLALTDFYPQEGAMLDFNACGQAPVAREMASMLVHVIFRTKNPKIMGSSACAPELAQLCKTLLSYYVTTMREKDPAFTVDMRLLRLFMAQQLLKDTLFFPSTHSCAIDRFERIIQLLDISQHGQTLDEWIDLLSRASVFG